MILFGKIFPYLYMAAFVVIGWRLYGIRWDWWLKAASGAAMITAPPLLFILPALRHGGGMTDLAFWIGIAMWLMGTFCLLGGMLGAYLRARPRAR
ncbi:MAG TPA: hypothetical protein VF509_10350 [Sphingobium sp.]